MIASKSLTRPACLARVLTVLYTFLFVGVCFAEADSQPRRVLWIVADSLRQDHLGYAGYTRDTSPFLDAISKKSVAFQWAIAPGNMTHISAPAYFSGRFFTQLFENPFRHESGWLPPWPKTAATAFQHKGFKTLAWTTNVVFAKKNGFARGFDSFSEVYPRATPTANIDQMIAVIDQEYKDSGQQEFIYLHLMDCHLPYRPPFPYDRRYIQDYKRDVVIEGELLDSLGKRVTGNAPFLSQRHDVNQEDIDFLIAQYDGAIRYFDERMPALLEAFDYDPANDLLVFFADHGEQFFEHGYWGHGYKTMPQEIRVPLVFRWDGLVPRMISQPVSLLDLYPTCAELFGLEPPQGTIGQSLLPLLRGADETPRYIYTEFYDTRGNGGSIVGPDYLYHLNTRAWVFEPWRMRPIQENLFDLRKDPSCEHDVLASALSDADRLNGIMRQLNPRLDRAAPERLRGVLSESSFGPNLVPSNAEGNPDWKTPGNAIAPDGTALRMSGSGTEAQLTIDTLENRVYLLSFDYALEQGAIEIAVQSLGRSTFQLELVKPEPSGRVRCLIAAGPPQTVISARVDNTGIGHIDNIRFSVAEIPTINMVAWKVPKQAPDPAAPIDDQERAVLRALGYAE